MTLTSGYQRDFMFDVFIAHSDVKAWSKAACGDLDFLIGKTRYTT